MPVKKTAAAKKPAAKKTTPAKKTAPAKSAAPALAKKVTAAKTKKSASASKPSENDRMDEFVTRVCAAIVAGDLDGHLVALDDALIQRQNAHAAETAKAKKTAAKKVPASPKRTTKTDEEETPVTLTAGSTYQVKESVKNIGGAKVKFHRFKVDDESKAVVEMLVDKPGYPKGKRVALSVKTLLAVAAKKTAAKRVKK